MANEIRTERLFWASMGDSDVSQTFGPFSTAEEAESNSRRLGWRYVAVWTRQVDEFDTVLELRKRVYELEQFDQAKYLLSRNRHLPQDLDELRSKLISAREAEGAYKLKEDEAKFFEAYEKQMQAPTTFACAECGEEIEEDNLHEVPIEHMDGSKETLRFHGDFKRCCPLKWGHKRLSATADKLDAIVKLYDAIKAELRAK
jgi:RNA polymerase-binding transcription factor DksA